MGRSTRNFQRRQDGFTIIELMISTVVLSIILLMVTAMMLNIGNLYYKGVNQANVQRSARTIIDSTSQELELASNFATGTHTYGGFPIQAYCMGTTRYSYVTGVQIGQGNEPNLPSGAAGPPRISHVAWRDINTSGACNPLDLTQPDPTAAAGAGNSQPGSGTEQVGSNSRLAYFSVSGNSPYAIALEVVQGDYDLLNNTTGSPANPVRCRGDAGRQFCATAALSTTVIRRL